MLLLLRLCLIMKASARYFYNLYVRGIFGNKAIDKHRASVTRGTRGRCCVLTFDESIKINDSPTRATANKSRRRLGVINF
jgi:hypothetical protein